MSKPQPEAVYLTDLPDAAVSFDVEQFDNAVRHHGVTFVHMRAMRCPVGLIDEHDIRRPHADHSGCSNGFLYTQAGEVTCLFTGNGTSAQFSEVGVLDASNVSITLPRFYDGTTKPVHIAPFDRLYLKEESIAVVDWQLFTTNGAKDKLRFPVVAVDDLVDSNNVRYTQGVDFSIEDGRIVWTGTNRPGHDAQTGRGLVCGVRFMYRPYWYVKSLVHEVRVAQVPGPNGTRAIERMPQAVTLQREHVYEKNEVDPDAPDQDRQPSPPAGPRFGSR